MPSHAQALEKGSKDGLMEKIRIRKGDFRRHLEEATSRDGKRELEPELCFRFPLGCCSRVLKFQAGVGVRVEYIA